jgi:hypothetical protein
MQRARPDLIDPSTVAVTRQLWVAGVPAATIAENVGIPRRMVRRLSEIHKWGDRRHQPRKTKPRVAIPPETVAEIVAMYQSGVRKSEICYAVRASAHVVDRVIDEQGLERRLEPLTREYVSEWVSPEEDAASQASLDLAPGIRGVAQELRERPIRREIHDGPDSTGSGIRVFTFANGGFRGRSL